ncbi:MULTISPECIES: phosphatase PAP2 family protein [Halomonadaceae]|nr:MULTISPECIES: phosphatase PAP2 family protein [Halomonas]
MSPDIALLHAINGLASQFPALNTLMIAITRFGVLLMVLAVVPLWWARSQRDRERHLATSAGLAFIGGLMLNQLVLLFVQRARPYTDGLSHLLIAPSADPSFPSDHATAVTAIAATFLLQRRFRSGGAFALAGLLVMLSRVYVGTHYPSDVLGGLVTGCLAALVVRGFYTRECWLNRRLVRLL